jgi:cytidine deaminase
MSSEALLQKANEVLKFSYSPYSRFRVAAAVLTKSGKVYTGVNVENASYGATICAERTAILKAVSEGEREIEAIAIISDLEGTIYPCGICRQFMGEFSDKNTKVICSNKKGEFVEMTIGEMIPHYFHLEK